MTLAQDSFDTLYSEFGQTVTRRPADGSADVTGIPALWWEDRIHRDYDEHTQRTERQGTITITTANTIAAGDQWFVNGDLWQVERKPFLEGGLYVIPVRRDEKVRTASSRGHIL